MLHVRRRTFLKTLGAALLGSQLPGRAHAAGTARRMVVVFSPNGTAHGHWRPTGQDTQFSFAPGSILEPLAAHKSKLLILDGIDFKNATNHEAGMAAMLTGGGGANTQTRGASVDQYVASQIGGMSRFASLELGVHTSAWGGSRQTRMAYRSAGEMVPPDDDPNGMFRRLFGAMAGGQQELDRTLMLRKSVIDLVRDETRALKGRLGMREQVKLDQHLDALRSVESALTAAANAPTGACTPPMVAQIDKRSNDGFPAVGRAQTDLLVAALACDMTKVATLQWSHTVSPTVFSWLNISEGHHALSHIGDSNPAGVARFAQTERWFAEQFAYLLDRLDALPDPAGGGSLLDTSVVLWAKEMGDPRLHNCLSVPFVIAGSGDGYFSTGRYLRYQSAPHQKLLVSLCQAMGLQNGTFGEPTFGTGPLEGLV